MRKTGKPKLKKVTEISIPTSLFAKVKKRIKGTEFSSVSEYVTYILSEVLAEEEVETNKSSREEEELVKSRLKALGYLED